MIPESARHELIIRIYDGMAFVINFSSSRDNRHQSDVSAISPSVDFWGSPIRISDSGVLRSMADITVQCAEKWV